MIKGDQNARLLSRGSALAVMFYLLLGTIVLSALTANPAQGDDSVGSTDEDEAQGETVTGSIVLDVYLDAEGRALIVGYLDTERRLEDLAFLEGSEYLYDEGTGELYALSNVLTSVLGDETRLTFEAEGEWDECHLAFYLPKDAELLAVSCSEGLEYSVSEAEDSLAVAVLGYEVEGAEVTIDYNFGE